MMNPPESIGALSNIPKDVQTPQAMPLGDMPEGSVEQAGDVVPMFQDPFIYLQAMLQQGTSPLDTIDPLRETYGYSNMEAHEVLNNFFQR